MSLHVREVINFVGLHHENWQRTPKRQNDRKTRYISNSYGHG